MRKLYTNQPVALRFRRWSRKGYAAFISVQRAVTIGQLSARISERFQVKNGSIHTSVLTVDKANEGETEKEEDTCRPGSPESILSLLFLQAVCPMQTVSRPAASYVPTYKRQFFRNRGKFQSRTGAFRDFRLYKYEMI